MRIWSIQSREAWEHLNEHGRLEASKRHSTSSWPHAYDWMRDQLADRIGEPSHLDAMPLWGWYQWAGTTKKRPDLRFIRHHWGPEGNHVMIECELPDDQVLLSDHDAWHVIIGNGFLSLTEQEDSLFSKKEKLGRKRNEKFGPYLDRKIQNSWARVFDLEALDSDYWGSIESKSIQASFWRIELSQVKSHKPFTSKYPKHR